MYTKKSEGGSEGDVSRSYKEKRHEQGHRHLVKEIRERRQKRGVHAQDSSCYRRKREF